MAALMLWPMGLAFFAALIGKYPYCGMRVLVFMTPAICLFVGAGVALSRERLSGWSRFGVVALYVVLAIPFVHTIRRTVDPWPRAEVGRAAEWVIADWKDGDLVGFSANWESEYYFRDRPEKWLTTERAWDAKRVWYVSVCPVAAVRHEILKTMGPEWRAAEVREHRDVTVVVFEKAEP